jgi:hypothetical protein
MNRDNVELLKILRDFLPKYLSRNKGGICGAVYMLPIEGRISIKEISDLLQIISDNNPTTLPNDTYWWPKGELEPRLKFIDRLITKYNG